GPIPKETNYLILASKIKLFASLNFFTKVTIRANRMWMVCPKQDSDAGKNFFDTGKFQEILEKIEELKGDKFQVIQKKDTVRFVVQEIADIEEALSFLKQLNKAEVHA
ncbi:MAG TPA: hypothetical protein VJ941_10815, partial [Gracilimonas sp.]|nr:hypothetical protein [Gracilimonas sp.]